MGKFVWQNTDFISMSFGSGSFLINSDSYSSKIDINTYDRLDRWLSKSEQAVLIFHIPLRTDETYKYGGWPNNRNLTLDPRDHLYDVIKKHHSKIIAIFNGHIHKAISTTYQDIPLFICPFFDKKTFCTLEIKDRLISVRFFNFHSDELKTIDANVSLGQN